MHLTGLQASRSTRSTQTHSHSHHREPPSSHLSRSPPRPSNLSLETPTHNQHEAQHCHLPDHPDPFHPDCADRIPDLLPADEDGSRRDSKLGERYDERCVDAPLYLTTLRRLGEAHVGMVRGKRYLTAGRCGWRTMIRSVFMFMIYGDIWDATYAIWVHGIALAGVWGLFTTLACCYDGG